MYSCVACAGVLEYRKFSAFSVKKCLTKYFPNIKREICSLLGSVPLNSQVYFMQLSSYKRPSKYLFRRNYNLKTKLKFYYVFIVSHTNDILKMDVFGLPANSLGHSTLIPNINLNTKKIIRGASFVCHKRSFFFF